jgi:hypothetical protein
MRLVWILLMLASFAEMADGQSFALLKGETEDCFAGKTIHPAQVDVYVFDATKASHISSLLSDLKKNEPKGDEQDVEAYGASYDRLRSAVRKAKSLAHARSDDQGRFSFSSLPVGKRVLVVGLADREDDLAYYASARLTLEHPENSAKLDFNAGAACTSK